MKNWLKKWERHCRWKWIKEKANSRSSDWKLQEREWTLGLGGPSQKFWRAFKDVPMYIPDGDYTHFKVLKILRSKGSRKALPVAFALRQVKLWHNKHHLSVLLSWILHRIFSLREVRFLDPKEISFPTFKSQNQRSEVEVALWSVFFIADDGNTRMDMP